MKRNRDTDQCFHHGTALPSRGGLIESAGTAETTRGAEGLVRLNL